MNDPSVEGQFNSAAPKRLESPTSLTEFAPLSSDEKSPHFFSRLFSRTKVLKSPLDIPVLPPEPDDIPSPIPEEPDSNLPRDVGGGSLVSLSSSTSSSPFKRKETADPLYVRSVANVMRRISSLLDKRNMLTSSCRESDFKQYWMPDSNCKECYDCGDKFTTFRRRHHCRICGQIFCNRCCNQVISGKSLGYSGDLRVCKYCCKVAETYLPSLDNPLESSDVWTLQEDMAQRLLCAADRLSAPTDHSRVRRKSSTLGFREEDIARAKFMNQPDLSDFSNSIADLTTHERRAIHHDESGLRDLWKQVTHPVSGADFQSHRHRLRTYTNCVVGSTLVEWLIRQAKAVNRSQAATICQAFMDVKLLVSVYHDQVFVDGYSLYQPGENNTSSAFESPATIPEVSPDRSSSQESQEPLWVKEIQTLEAEPSGCETDESVEQEECQQGHTTRLSSSSSIFYLDMNLKESKVMLSRPHPSPKAMATAAQAKRFPSGTKNKENVFKMPTKDDILHGALLGENENMEESGAVLRIAQMLVENTEGRKTFDNLNSAYKNVEQSLVQQLLSCEGLSLSWCDTIIPIIHRVADTVWPDVRMENEEKDIRKYIQLKKIPGGSKSECCIVHGVVCTKHVAHKKMKQSLVDPRILLLDSAISYQRIENKLTSLDPILMQEFEYLKNAIAKITVYKPSLILVEKTVSSIALDMLLNLGITVVRNVKPSVMKRVAHCTQAGIVSSIEAHLKRPKLGLCHNFKVQTYQKTPTKNKTLMFFDGCPSNLGCTIILRGGSSPELRKVKKIILFMAYVAYSWNLEHSFLMECCAFPPTHIEDLPLILQPNEDISQQDEPEKVPEKPITPVSTNTLKPLTLFPPKSKGEPSPNVRSADDEGDKKLEFTFVDDCSDPLRSYLKTEDENVFFPPENELQVEALPFSNHFRKALDDVVLCCTPHITFSLPYLETEAGRSCQLRDFFAENLYWSAQLLKDGMPTKKLNLESEEASNAQSDSVYMKPCHKFVNNKLTSNLLNNNELQSLLSDFRARGGRFQNNGLESRLNKLNNTKVTDVKVHLEVATDKEEFDYLSPYNHQKLAVSFCSYSETSYNAPRYCNGPVLFNMGFYGENDIPLGGFLERYCFSESYLCAAGACESPTTEHVRKFAHDNGCVVIQIYKKDNFIASSENDIIMWSICPKCNESSPFVAMSVKTWAMSFAKYLEFRFHGGQYLRRGSPKGCTHSLHQEHYHCFAHKRIVASLQYIPILMREVCLPSPTISINEEPIPLSSVVEEIKILAVRGYGVYSTILEHLCTLKVECQGTKHEPAVNEMMDQQQMERSKFRERIEDIQLNLTSPTMENKQPEIGLNASGVEREACLMMWKIADSITLLKIQIAEAVHNWNSKIQDFVSVKKKEEKVTLRGGATHNIIQSSGSSQTGESTVASGQDALAALSRSIQTEPPDSPSQPALHQDQSPLTLSGSEPVWKLGSSGGSKVEGSQPFQSIAEESASETRNALDSCSSVQENSKELRPLSDTSSLLSSWQEISSGDLRDSDLGDSDVFERKLETEALTEACLEKQQEECRKTLEALAKLEVVTNTVCNTPEPCMATSRSSSSLSSYTLGGSPAPLTGAFPALYCHLLAGQGDSDTPLLQQSPPIAANPDDDRKADARGHERSKSDGAEKITENRLSRSKLEEERSVKTEKKERGSMKNLISQLLNTSAITPVQSPFPFSEHHLLPCGDRVPIIVYDQEPGAIIAYALASNDYEQQLQELKLSLSTAVLNSFKEGLNSSPTLKRRFQLPRQPPERTNSVETLPSLPLAEASPIDFSDFALCSSQELEKSVGKANSKGPNLHIELQFSDSTTRFYCRVYFAEQFRKLRRLLFPEGEERFIRSLSRCVAWMARGGKSGSTFCKTHDDRFILKQMSRFEVTSFLDFAPYYLQYITRACTEKKPTVLAKIVGVYRIGFKNSATGRESKLDLLAMENLFYGRSIQQKFDLKGSVRNRLVTPSGHEEGDIVLLDENLLKMMCDSPLYIRPHSRQILSSAITEDSQFLSSHMVMDYSLLVGLDDHKKELVVGIIDYIRTFTWDKKLEMVVKSRSILGGHREPPTVVSPEQYRKRFCGAMDSYFFWVPDRWSELGQGLKI